MRIFSSKKAVEAITDLPFWVIFAVAVGATIVAIVSIATLYVKDAAVIPYKVEDELILMPRFYSSEDCFAYEDDQGRVHKGTIDLNKFKQENMEKCFPESDVGYAFSLSLEAPEINADIPVIYTFNWVEDLATKKIAENVFVLYNGMKYPAKLRVGIKNVK